MSSENEPVPAAAAVPAAAFEASEFPGAAGVNKPEENADEPEEKKDDEGDEDNNKKRRKKKKSPKKKKKKSRPPNFNDDDDDVLFAAMEVTLPHGQHGWEIVTAEYNAAMTANGRADLPRDSQGPVYQAPQSQETDRRPFVIALATACLSCLSSYVLFRLPWNGQRAKKLVCKHRIALLFILIWYTKCKEINIHADVAMSEDTEDEDEDEEDEGPAEKKGTPAEDPETPKSAPKPKVPPPLAGRQPGFKRTSSAIEQLGVAASALTTSPIPQNNSSPTRPSQCPPHQFNHLVCENVITLYCALCGEVKKLASP